MATVLGDTNLVNQEATSIGKVTSEEILRTAQCVLDTNNCSTIYYQRQD
jgi:hypothetical protein